MITYSATDNFGRNKEIIITYQITNTTPPVLTVLDYANNTIATNANFTIAKGYDIEFVYSAVDYGDFPVSVVKSGGTFSNTVNSSVVYTADDTYNSVSLTVNYVVVYHGIQTVSVNKYFY